MGDFVINNIVLEKYIGFDSTVEIPSEIEEIGVGAFRGNTTIVKVVLPEGIKHIMISG